jgi:hypothetical protein
VDAEHDFQTASRWAQAPEPSGSPSPAKALGLFTPVNGAKLTELPQMSFRAVILLLSRLWSGKIRLKTIGISQLTT